MEKYKFENNKAVVDLPSIITISSTSVSIEHAGSTDTANIPDNANLTIQIGNIESYNPTLIESEPVPEVTPNPSSGGSSSGSGDSGESGGNSGSQEGGSEQGGESGGGPITPPSGNESYATEGTAGTIGFNIINRSGQDLYYNGQLKLHIKQGNGSNAWDSNGQLVPSGEQVSWPLNGPTDIGEPYQGYYYPHYWSNNKISNGNSKLFTMSSFKVYDSGTSGVTERNIPLSTYCDGNWYFVTSDNVGFQQHDGTGGIGAIWMGCAILDNGEKKSDTFLYNISPVRSEDSKIQTGKIYNLIVYKAHTESTHWNQIIK